MRTIWKVSVLPGMTYVSIPAGAELVHFDFQDGYPQAWMRCDPDSPHESRQFQLVGTGWPFDDDWKHVGTVLDEGLVWHLLER